MNPNLEAFFKQFGKVKGLPDDFHPGEAWKYGLETPDGQFDYQKYQEMVKYGMNPTVTNTPGVSSGGLKNPNEPYDPIKNPYLPAGTVTDPNLPNWIRDLHNKQLRSMATDLMNSPVGFPATSTKDLPLVGAGVGSASNPATSLSTPSGNGLGGGLRTPGPAGGSNTPISSSNLPGPGGLIPEYQPPGGTNTSTWGRGSWENNGGSWGNSGAWGSYRAGFGRENAGFGPQFGRQPAPGRPQSHSGSTNINWLYYSNALRSPGRRAARAA